MSVDSVNLFKNMLENVIISLHTKQSLMHESGICWYLLHEKTCVLPEYLQHLLQEERTPKKV